MKETPTIYKVHDQYLLNREELFDIVKNKIDKFFIINLNKDLEEMGNYPISRSGYTDIQNVFNIGSVTLPMDVLIVDEEYGDIQTNAQILIRLNLSVKEEIVE